jgi:hypothetical protein
MEESKHAGFVGRATYEPTGARIVVYVAREQGLDVDGRYAVVCRLHATLVGETSKRRALRMARFPEFCEECMLCAPKSDCVEAKPR